MPMPRFTLSLLLALALIAPAVGQDASRSDENAKLERDRQAILDMAGEYEVSFNFYETVPLAPGYEKHDPKIAGATEMVRVIEDSPRKIVLQHVLVMENRGEEGGEPHVQKHWRQDWTYEPESYHAYRGMHVWERQSLSEAERDGAWVQTVYQVDDSPRYAGHGQWNHHQDYSEWTSNHTWRPLPRRERQNRLEDYDVMRSTHRLTIHDGGWTHEQDSDKLDLQSPGQPVDEHPVLTREVGLNTYAKLTGDEGPDFAAGDKYWEQTREFWADVRERWAEVFQQQDRVEVSAIDGKPIFMHMFDYSDKLTEPDTQYDPEAGQQFIDQTIANATQTQ